jgi:hypothetical protein
LLPIHNISNQNTGGKLRDIEKSWGFLVMIKTINLHLFFLALSKDKLNNDGELDT